MTFFHKGGMNTVYIIRMKTGSFKFTFTREILGAALVGFAVKAGRT